MNEYFIHFIELSGFVRAFRIQSRSLLGAKFKATRIFNTNAQPGRPISAIEIHDAYSTDSFCMAHRFIGSKKWSSFL
ncbi:hypothetical protein [Leptospira alexanderi]|uniref:hypothetical protein n=1 Tax=Leptospira alexanderi TaxID=100053 RepID=UPI00099139BF|nr:hypothetical protein [Leptospira alexanderi]